MNTKINTIGIDNNLDRARIQKLLTTLPSEEAFESFSRERQRDITIK